MDTTSLADAKARLSELVSKAEAGEPQIITRRGKPVAKLVAIEPAKKMRINLDEIRAFVKTLKPDPEDTGDFMRRFRDSARY